MYQNSVLNENLITGLQSAKGFHSKLLIKSITPLYRSIIASTNFSKREIITTIPLNHIITDALIFNDKSFPSNINDFAPKWKSSVSISLFILKQSSEVDSFWSPYLDFLEGIDLYLPLAHPLKDFKSISFTKAYKALEKNKENLKRIHGECQKSPFFNGISLKRFVKLVAVVSSRMFGLEIDGENRNALIPLADLLNHSGRPTARWRFDNEKRVFVIETIRQIAKGEEVLLSYGKKDNFRLFLNYGFALSPNPFNKVYVTFDDDWREYNENWELVKQTQKISYWLSKNYDDKETLEMFTTLRLIYSSRETILKFQRKCIKRESNHQEVIPISIKNEIQCLEKLKEISLKQLRLYPSSQSLKERMDVFKETNGNCGDKPIKRLIQLECEMQKIKFLEGERNVLEFFVDLVEGGRRLFELSKERFYEETKNFDRDVKNPFRNYISRVAEELMGGIGKGEIIEID